MKDGKRIFGYVGCGHVGERTLLEMVAAAGIDVAYSVVGDHEPFSDLEQSFPGRLRIVTPEEAAEQGDWLTLLMPFEEHRLLRGDLGSGKPVIDMTNLYTRHLTGGTGTEGPSTTSSEIIQRHFREANVVKAINNIDYKHFRDLARPQAADSRTALPLAGDDESAKADVTWLLGRLGFDAVDVGPLSEGWRFQPGMPACHLPYGAGGADDVRRQPAAPVSAAALRQILWASTCAP
ncbi:NADPH-dependent F420 reductase [Streptomyces sp. NPDC088354]|uniref:NADPH-dependent F420 reductase n=1 Tax=unclassified Streptomyces TaxID=2593676 RepID=UPI0029A06991|nr:NAD(P)-binding domain-containing protein [Streptomyces sp. MI02-7b]MDX3074946.1 NADP oxidoreductase [Streptomyces sp. MI02-7b]